MYALLPGVPLCILIMRCSNTNTASFRISIVARGSRLLFLPLILYIAPLLLDSGMFRVNASIFVCWMASKVAAFHVAPALMHKKIGSAMDSSTVLRPIRCFDKYYQLEELEDRDACTTELFLQANGVVVFGDTDGPQYVEAVGTWNVAEGTNDYFMTITRTFTTGTSGTDMGEFGFDLTKYYRGEMTMVGESVAISGTMSTADTAAELEKDVGYFNMIDATKERLMEEPNQNGGRVSTI